MSPRLTIAGVVLNGVGSERHRALLGEALDGIAMPLLGVLPRHASLELPSRHLGCCRPGSWRTWSSARGNGQP
jgi:cobyrinic acid a,c-diamide synthase